jgi:DNA-binding response OmpR family regulator
MEALRDQSTNRPFYRDEHLFVDLHYKRAILDSQALILTRKEYGLLALLVQHAGEIIPRAILLMQIWGYAPKTRTRTLDVHIGRLRKKLGHEGRRIETIFGKGYSFCPSQDGRRETEG